MVTGNAVPTVTRELLNLVWWMTIMGDRKEKEYPSTSQKKGKRLEPGIWREKEGKGYMVEVSYTDAHSGKRIREIRTIHRLDLAREWRQTR